MLLHDIIADEFRLLTFDRVRADLQERWKPYLAFGLFFTWLAGIGRYWDNPRALVWQHLGFGSVVYVFCLAFIIWLLLAPLKPRNWNYKLVLVFVTLTAPPALLYAIPVEMFFSLSTAQTINYPGLKPAVFWHGKRQLPPLSQLPLTSLRATIHPQA